MGESQSDYEKDERYGESVRAAREGGRQAS